MHDCVFQVWPEFRATLEMQLAILGIPNKLNCLFSLNDFYAIKNCIDNDHLNNVFSVIYRFRLVWCMGGWRCLVSRTTLPGFARQRWPSSPLPRFRSVSGSYPFPCVPVAVMCSSWFTTLVLVDITSKNTLEFSGSTFSLNFLLLATANASSSVVDRKSVV